MPKDWYGLQTIRKQSSEEAQVSVGGIGLQKFNRRDVSD